MKQFPWRIVLYLVFLGYLFVDLKACNGPLKRAISKRSDVAREDAAKYKWVAIVNQEPVSYRQLEVAVFRHLYQRGKAPEEIPEANLKMIRRAVLQSLINETIVRQHADGDGYEAPAEEVDAFVSRWISQFASGTEMAKRSIEQRLEDSGLREELGRIWSHKKWLEQRIAPGIDVTDEEVRAWFDANRETGEGFTEPEKVRARHIFLSTVETDDETRETLIRDLHRQIVEKESTFEEIAKTYSEDPKTKKIGGDLNWLARDRVPDDFSEVVFAMDPETLSEPFRTGIGWHIVEVLEKQAERPVDFKEVEAEIRDHLENQRTEDTVKVLLEKLRSVANIRLFPENI
ncbi:MAG: peptidylprolyl isomerase [Verrucomicrobiales bacterium]|nr:peptidylprolyl isomerase [Verrucomicrobiales bacterium]